MPIPTSVPRVAETKTSSASNQVGAITAQAGEVWNVTASGGDVWIEFGATPTAASGDGGWRLLAGQTRDFAVSAAGETYAIKD
jgi:hypothetical protein